MAVALTIDQRALQAVVSALKSEEDGKSLRTQLNRTLKAALLPAKAEASSAIQGMPVKGDSDGSMRAAISSSLAISVRNTGKATGVSLSAPRGKYPRGFTQAPRRFNADAFRRQVYGNGTWVEQTGAPGWFDKSVQAHSSEYTEAVEETLVSMASRIIARVDARAAF